MDEITAKIIVDLMLTVEALKEDYKNVVAELTNTTKEEIGKRLTKIRTESQQKIKDKILTFRDDAKDIQDD